MIAANDLRVGSLVLRQNPNLEGKSPQICRVFRIDEKENVVQIECLEHKNEQEGGYDYICFEEGRVVHMRPSGIRTPITTSCTISIDDISPIPPTEDILVRCGFKPITNRKTFLIKLREAFELKYTPLGQKDECYFVIVKDEGEYCHIVPADSNKGCSFIPLKSLNRLQNLFFELTVKELEVKL